MTTNIWPTLLNFRGRTPKRTDRSAIELLKCVIKIGNFFFISIASKQWFTSDAYILQAIIQLSLSVMLLRTRMVLALRMP
jgi:hypothetical protein